MEGSTSLGWVATSRGLGPHPTPVRGVVTTGREVLLAVGEAVVPGHLVHPVDIDKPFQSRERTEGVGFIGFVAAFQTIGLVEAKGEQGCASGTPECPLGVRIMSWQWYKILLKVLLKSSILKVGLQSSYHGADNAEGGASQEGSPTLFCRIFLQLAIFLIVMGIFLGQKELVEPMIDEYMKSAHEGA